MNHKTYLKLISAEFGGLKKTELEAKLKKLVSLVIYEQINPVESKTVIAGSPEKVAIKSSVVSIGNSNVLNFQSLSNYDKAMNLIRGFNNVGWVFIDQVPADIFNDFWAIVEMHSEIILDNERNYQYFKVENFSGKKISDEKDKKSEDAA